MSDWRIAEQYFSSNDFAFETKPFFDGYVITVKIGAEQRSVFCDPAGRVTHVRYGQSSGAGAHDCSPLGFS